MRTLSVTLSVAFGATLLLAGCPTPPPEPGPPPATRAPEGAPVVTEGEGPSAPVLPDPRSELPPVDPTSGQTDIADPVVVTDPTGFDVAPSPTAGVRTAPPSSSPGIRESVYSVQVFTSSTQENAERTAASVRAVVPNQVEVVHGTDGKWRVFAGRSVGREPIDALRDRLRANGFPDAWTAERSVQTTTPDAHVPAGETVYSVQALASSNQVNAERVATDLRSKTSMPVEVVQVGQTWKVFVGRSSNRAEIDAERDRLRTSGYPGAWTYRREGAQ